MSVQVYTRYKCIHAKKEKREQNLILYEAKVYIRDVTTSQYLVAFCAEGNF